MNNQNAKKVDPNTLLDLITAQAHNKSYDVAMGISTQLVTSLIRAGKLTNVKVSVEAIEESTNLLRAAIEKELIALSLNEYTVSLPKNETKV